MNLKSPLEDKVILVVDDEPDILDTIEDILYMCDVHTASNFSSALASLSKHTFDVVVLDIQGVNGFELLKKAVLRNFPTVMLTANSSTPGSLKKSIKLGAAAFLPKEYMPELKDLLEDIVMGGGKRFWWLEAFKQTDKAFTKQYGPDWKDKDIFFKEFKKSIDKGYVQIYTGNGKGKTTAALGLALRAAGRGKKTYIAQFMKKTQYGELISIANNLKEFITIAQFGLPDFHRMENGITEEEISAAMQGIAAVNKAIESNKYDIIILDEANILTYFKIIDIKYFLEIIDNKPEKIELILTGRNAPQEFIDRADLVTEMQEVKHYYTKNVPAREGTEK